MERDGGTQESQSTVDPMIKPETFSQRIRSVLGTFFFNQENLRTYKSTAITAFAGIATSTTAIVLGANPEIALLIGIGSMLAVNVFTRNSIPRKF